MNQKPLFYWFKKPIRGLLLTLVLILVGILGNARPIQSVEAKTVALNWINTCSPKYYTQTDISTVYSRVEAGIPKFYIISFKPSGWVMVSGTDQINPVLGYSLNSQFLLKALPIQLKSWLDAKVEEITYAIEEEVESEAIVKEKWNEFGKKVLKRNELIKDKSVVKAPLIRTSWDQGRYYNELAPYDESSSAGNDHVWIGCVATAMAQIMKYWSYPTSGIGSNSYTHPSYGVLSANFENAIYDWGAMPNSLSSANEEVQKISYHCAVSVNMDFGPGGSGAFLNGATSALKGFFKYNIPAYPTDKGRWNESDWIQLLKNELNLGRPILYSGYNQSLSSGHAFVCDGYNSDNYFHFNWGWSGFADGYFLITALTPSGRDYSYSQSALLSIEPVMPAYFGIPYSEGFENGNAGEFSVYGVNQITVAESHSGSKSLQLGTATFKHDLIDAASICFTVPPDAELSFWVKRSTPLVSSLNNQQAMLMPQDGTSSLIEFFSGDYNDEEWVNYNADLRSYTGQVVRLVFLQSVSDASKYQWMYIDDITINGRNNNLAPFKPSNPTPINESKYISLYPILKWSGGDPNGDDLIYKIYFGTSDNPPLVGSVFDNSYQLPGLTQKTKYYWKIISEDSDYSSESDTWSFTTKGIPPTVEECGISGLTSNSVDICGKVVRDNGSEVVRRGVCWSIFPSPSIYTNTKTSNESSDPFVCTASGLLPYTTYHYKTYAESEEGIGYSNINSFRTEPGLPVVAINKVEDVRRNSVHIIGNLDVLNDTIVFRSGVVWSLKSGFDPNEASRTSIDGNWINPGAINFNLRNIPGPATIFFRVFAENSAGISYSEEGTFITTNAAPFLDLDEDNSSMAWGCNYKGITTEQTSGGFVADKDILITDEDKDSIRSAIFILDNNIKGEDEYLYYGGSNENLTIKGNQTSHLEIYSNFLSNVDWVSVISKVEYINNYDAPGENVDRKIKIFVTDGADSSNITTATIDVVPVNDPPNNQQVPRFNTTPAYGISVDIQNGVWVDDADELTGTFTYSHKLEMRDEIGNISDLGEISGKVVEIGENVCGQSVRIVETVTDFNSGGSNISNSTAWGDWVKVERAEQTINFDFLPIYSFQERYCKLSGTSSSGFPLTYKVPENDKVYVSNDTAFFLKTGRTVISSIQEGNSCFYPSILTHRILTVEKGEQEIETADDILVSFGSKGMKFPVTSSSGLMLSATSSNNSIVAVKEDSLLFKGIGKVSVTFSQEGNENYYPALNESVGITVEKGSQEIYAEYEEKLFFGNENSPFQVSSTSGLPVNVVSLNPEILQVDGNSFVIKGVGNASIRISQDGDQIWKPADDVAFEITVDKGQPQISIEAIGEKRFGDEPFIPVLVTSSGLKADLSIENTSIADFENGEIVIKGCGETNVIARINESEFWNEATAIATLKVDKADQYITFFGPDTLKYGEVPTELLANSNSGLIVEFKSLDENIVKISGNYTEIINAGITQVEAYQLGNSNWNEAESVLLEFVILKTDQIISHSIPDTVVFDNQVINSGVSTTSGLPVTISSSNTDVVKVIGEDLQIQNFGVSQLTISQEGNNNFNPAETEVRLFVKEPVNVKDEYLSKISIYPNPAKEYLIIGLNSSFEDSYNLSVVNVLGEVFSNFSLKGNTNKINIKDIPDGVYFIKVNAKGRSIIQKFIIAKSH